MTVNLINLKRTLACSLFTVGIALATGAGLARAGEGLSVDQIIKALTPNNLTRSLTATPRDAGQNAEEGKFLDTLKNRTTRSLTLGEREKISTLTQDKPNIDIDINFKYNSAKLMPSAKSSAATLGEALSSANFKGSTFVVEGHTDGKGGTAFNQRLSERRAEAVKHFLVQHNRIPAASLVAVGYGESKLKNPADPTGADNRRVRVVNMANTLANK